MQPGLCTLYSSPHFPKDQEKPYDSKTANQSQTWINAVMAHRVINGSLFDSLFIRFQHARICDHSGNFLQVSPR